MTSSDELQEEADDVSFPDGLSRRDMPRRRIPNVLLENGGLNALTLFPLAAEVGHIV